MRLLPCVGALPGPTRGSPVELTLSFPPHERQVAEYDPALGRVVTEDLDNDELEVLGELELATRCE